MKQSRRFSSALINGTGIAAGWSWLKKNEHTAPIFEIQSHIESIERDSSLCEEKNFARRAEAIDFIESHDIGQLEHLRTALEEIDAHLFRRIRATIRKDGLTGAAFKSLIDQYPDLNDDSTDQRPNPGYDNLDLFINGLLSFQVMPEQTRDVEPDMVAYQKTPARIVFELVETAHFRSEDVFVDLGAGLGQVAILVHLLAGITTRGIECEPAFCDYARRCAAELNLTRVTFEHVDARQADYSEGTVFFMFTPFRGSILQEVLERLRLESLRRRIKIITYGPCTAWVAVQNWLKRETPGDNGRYEPVCFSNFEVK